jgi:hypothetical protein
VNTVANPMLLEEFTIEATLSRPAPDYRQARLTVAPLVDNDNLTWIDLAGYTVATSRRPGGWPDEPSSFDFELVVADATVVGEAYLRHI